MLVFGFGGVLSHRLQLRLVVKKLDSILWKPETMTEFGADLVGIRLRLILLCGAVAFISSPYSNFSRYSKSGLPVTSALACSGVLWALHDKETGGRRRWGFATPL